MEKKNFRPDKIMMYFRAEWKVLALITVSGLIYNLGLMAGPWFEGKMAGCLMQILTGTERFPAMLRLAPAYVIVIGTVQLAEIYQAVLCAPVRQQCKLADEADPVPDTDT